MKLHFNPDGSYEVDADPEEAIKFIQLQRGDHAGEQNGKKVVFLNEDLVATLDCFRNFPEGLTSPEVAELIGGPAGTSSSRCNQLAKKNLIIRRNGHNGYVISPDIHQFDIRTPRSKKRDG